MKSEFRDLKLGDCCELITGFPFKSKNFLDEGDGKYKLARGINIKEGRFYWKDLEKTWDDINDDQQKYLLDEGDLLVSMDGSKVGKNWVEVSSLDLPSLLVQRVCCIRARNEISQKYIKYLISSSKFRRYIDSIKTGTSIPHISVKQLKDYPITIPGLLEQQRIANFLGALDKKIELNQKMNETLEEIAKALFKSWFIDFDPVKAKAEGRPIGLSKEISDLFPDSFEDSELGEIPKGWKNIKLGDIAKVSSGKRPPEKEEIKSNTCPYVVFGGAGPIGFCSNSLEFNKPAIITGRVGTLGKVFFLDQECWVSDNSILICDAESYTPIIFQTLKHTNLSSLNVGSTQPLVTGRDIKNINIVGPDKSVLDAYVSLFNNFKIRQNKIIEENEVLLKLRDILLPRLISGELLISDAENLIEEANA
jgi:type I restriction enzyme S subunit